MKEAKAKTIEQWIWFYFDKGFGIIPLKAKSKAPNIPSYKEYEFSRPNKKQVEQWLKDGKFKGIGVLCGIPSNDLCIIDIDREKIVKDLDIKFKKIISSGCWVSSTGKGYHIWTKNIETPGNTVLDGDVHIDFKTTGYIVVPPSIHGIDENVPQETPYKFINTTFDKLKPMTSRKTFEQMREKLRKLYDIKDVTEGDIKPIENITAACIANLLAGVADGSRDVAAFTMTQFYYRIKKLDKEAVRSVVKEWNKKNRPPLTDTQVNKCIKSGIDTQGQTGCTKLRSMKICPYPDTKECPFLHPNNPRVIKKKPVINMEHAPKTRQEVYERLRKWLFLRSTAWIDLICAVILSNDIVDMPLWLFLIANSSCAKSEILGAFDDYPKVMHMDQITPNTFATGKTYKGKKIADLGMKLQNASTILTFSDLACLKTNTRENKSQIWGQFRTLFDGRIDKKTGNTVEYCIYDNCHVTLLACTTPDIKKEYAEKNQLGTREVSYTINTKTEDNRKVMRLALTHRGKIKEKRNDIRQILQGFLLSKTLNLKYELEGELQEWTMNKVEELIDLRAIVPHEAITGEISDEISAEGPGRLIQQFNILYGSLKSIDENYPDERYKQIIENIVMSSGDALLYKMRNYFKEHKEAISLPKLHEVFSYGRRTIKSRCETLVKQGYLTKEISQVEIPVRNSINGTTRVVEMIFYTPCIKNTKNLDDFGDDEYDK